MKRDLNMNFSVEKLALFVEMAKYLGAEKAGELEREEEAKKKALAERKIKEAEEAKRTRVSKSQKKTGTIVTGSGAAIAITGLCLEGTIGTILSIAGGAVVIGGVLLLTVPCKKK